MRRRKRRRKKMSESKQNFKKRLYFQLFQAPKLKPKKQLFANKLSNLKKNIKHMTQTSLFSFPTARYFFVTSKCKNLPVRFVKVVSTLRH
jgi:hypothetical protein